jgi:hypothetical protein
LLRLRSRQLPPQARVSRQFRWPGNGGSALLREVGHFRWQHRRAAIPITDIANGEASSNN